MTELIRELEALDQPVADLLVRRLALATGEALAKAPHGIAERGRIEFHRSAPKMGSREASILALRYGFRTAPASTRSTERPNSSSSASLSPKYESNGCRGALRSNSTRKSMSLCSGSKSPRAADPNRSSRRT